MTAPDSSHRRPKKHRPDLDLEEPLQDDPVVRHVGNFIGIHLAVGRSPMPLKEIATKCDYDHDRVIQLVQLMEQEDLLTIMQADETGQLVVMDSRFGPGEDRIPPF